MGQYIKADASGKLEIRSTKLKTNSNDRNLRNSKQLEFGFCVLDFISGSGFLSCVCLVRWAAFVLSIWVK